MINVIGGGYKKEGGRRRVEGWKDREASVTSQGQQLICYKGRKGAPSPSAGGTHDRMPPDINRQFINYVDSTNMWITSTYFGKSLVRWMKEKPGGKSGKWNRPNRMFENLLTELLPSGGILPSIFLFNRRNRVEI